MKQNNYGMGDVAEATDRKVATVRKHEREGKFDINSLLSVSLYIAAARLERENAVIQEGREE